ncbi:metallophosphoesterase [Corallococcus sp. H22C18031201]|uniref:metallophosphoesterase family protein n=1 Tax=Citreicoccus inhibens TaxID=2849499 RepID=UPI000E7475A2|nr:metallophosphoesterase [Citreicoccus inhibens]MBU8895635.1 metallophosphoesterase [Citreicoccus inhibens]RJS20070.1 metallophosphoesterase [Corallococcus sp. H22C18031201]
MWQGVLAALLITACVRPAEERATRDAAVGREEVGGVSVEVEGGLASVRALAPGGLELWGQAPVFSAKVTTAADAPSGLLLTVHNAMPDAELTATDDSGGGVPVEPFPSVRPTLKVWRVGVRPGSVARLTVSPPDWDADAPFRFAALADVQEALSRVGDVYARMSEDPSLRFIFFAGDLTERGQREELEEFQQRLEFGARIPLFATLGNHETFTQDARAYHQRVGRGSQHFVFHGVHFSLVDSGNGTVDPIVETQLDGWLDEARDAVHVVAMHVPPLDPVGVRGGGFASRNEAAGLVGKLARAGVDLTLYGHIHSYYSFSNAGIPAFISGGGGAIPERFDGVGRHYLAVEVSPREGVRDVGLVRVD